MSNTERLVMIPLAPHPERETRRERLGHKARDGGSRWGVTEAERGKDSVIVRADKRC